MADVKISKINGELSLFIFKKCVIQILKSRLHFPIWRPTSFCKVNNAVVLLGLIVIKQKICLLFNRLLLGDFNYLQFRVKTQFPTEYKTDRLFDCVELYCICLTQSTVNISPDE